MWFCSTEFSVLTLRIHLNLPYVHNYSGTAEIIQRQAVAIENAQSTRAARILDKHYRGALRTLTRYSLILLYSYEDQNTGIASQDLRHFGNFVTPVDDEMKSVAVEIAHLTDGGPFGAAIVESDISTFAARRFSMGANRKETLKSNTLLVFRSTGTRNIRRTNQQVLSRVFNLAAGRTRTRHSFSIATKNNVDFIAGKQRTTWADCLYPGLWQQPGYFVLPAARTITIFELLAKVVSSDGIFPSV
jgi:hypothetical protein